MQVLNDGPATLDAAERHLALITEVGDRRDIGVACGFVASRHVIRIFIVVRCIKEPPLPSLITFSLIDHWQAWEVREWLQERLRQGCQLIMETVSSFHGGDCAATSLTLTQPVQVDGARSWISEGCVCVRASRVCRACVFTLPGSMEYSLVLFCSRTAIAEQINDSLLNADACKPLSSRFYPTHEGRFGFY